MRRPLRYAARWWIGLVLPAGLAAQRPTVSPPLARAFSRDTSITVWLFARPGVSTDSLTTLARGMGATVRVRSRWLRAVSVTGTTVALRALQREPGILHIQPVGRWRVRPAPPGAAPALVEGPKAAPAANYCGSGGDPTYGPSDMPYRQLNLHPLASAGYDGTGIRIVILDAGFNTLDPAFAGVTVTAQWDFVFGDSVVRDQPNDQPGAQTHGTAVWSLFAGLMPGQLVGIARGAHYLLAKTEDIRSETRVEEDNYVAALEWADSIGVDIASSSLGYLAFDNGFTYTPSELNGDVAVTSVAADSAAVRGILVVTAAGNNGPGFRTLVTPGDAHSVITAGAEDSLGTIAGFSSRGPTADGRLKPDLTAPGQDVCADWGGDLYRVDGTSFATPITAAAAALLKQVHPTLGPLAVRDALRAHATHHANPDSTYGWGRPDVAASATFPAGIVPQAPLPPTLPTITPVFRWGVGTVPPFATPVSYRLRAAHDTSYAAPFVDTTLTDITQLALARPLKGTRLYWRVDALAANGIAATTGSVGPITMPPWATLTTLSDSAGASSPTTQPVFTWHPTPVAVPPGPESFDLFVLRTNSQTPIFGAGGIPDTVFLLPIALEYNATYRWELVVHAGSDTSLVRSLGAFVVLDPTAPPATLLYQNFPNPFPGSGQSATCIWFDLATASTVTLEILDLRGGVVRHLLPSSGIPNTLPVGRYGRGAGGGTLCDPRLTWDGTADDGRTVPPGVYLSRFTAAGTTQFKRIVFRGRND